MSQTETSAKPRVLSREVGEGARFVLELRPEDFCFQGHFPDFPILPGVIQTDWAIRLGQEAFGPLGEFTGIQSLKFKDLTRPGERLELALSFDPSTGRLGFEYASENGKKSSGIIVFRR